MSYEYFRDILEKIQSGPNVKFMAPLGEMSYEQGFGFGSVFGSAFKLRIRIQEGKNAVLRIRIRDRVLFDPWIRYPGSGVGFFPDPGSQDHIFKIFLTIFLVKSSIIL
jgi:hypothetical protein